MYERVCGSCKHCISQKMRYDSLCSTIICDVDFHYVSVIDLSDFHCKKWELICDIDELDD